ncbi:hypothetical protein J6590_053517 [Homalodisca vitripennis]|nr:hypothetical protein J6590_053517 [Homalodisca vitripennis]
MLAPYEHHSNILSSPIVASVVNKKSRHDTAPYTIAQQTNISSIKTIPNYAKRSRISFPNSGLTLLIISAAIGRVKPSIISIWRDRIFRVVDGRGSLLSRSQVEGTLALLQPRPIKSGRGQPVQDTNPYRSSTNSNSQNPQYSTPDPPIQTKISKFADRDVPLLNIHRVTQMSVTHRYGGTDHQFNFLLVQRLESNAFTNFTPGIWSHVRLERSKSAMKNFKMNSSHRFVIIDTYTAECRVKGSLIVSPGAQLSALRCFKHNLSALRNNRVFYT